jgi:hypothetical protein
MTTLLGGRRWISLAAAFAMVMAAMAIGIPDAGAAKPAYDRDFRVTDVQLVAMADGTCVAKVWWDGLKGGRKIFVQFEMGLDLFGDSDYDGAGTTMPAAKQVLEVQRGLTGATQHSGYAEYAFAYPYGLNPTIAEDFYHLQVMVWDRNGVYGDSLDGDGIYANWEYGHDAAFCAA